MKQRGWGWRVATLLATMTATALLAACGGGSDNSSSSESAAAPSSSAAAATEAASSTEAAATEAASSEAASSEAASDTAAASSASGEPVTLTMWQTMNDEETKTLQSIIDAYKAAHPNVTVQVETVPFDQAQAKYDTAAQAGQAPDIMRSEIAWTPDYAAKGYLADLTDKVANDPGAQDYLDAPLNYNKFDGKTWGIPQVTDALALMINKQLATAAGITAAPASMDELLAACQKAGAGKGIFLRGDSYWVQPFVWAYGGGLIDTEAKQIQIADASSVAGLTAYKKLFDDPCAFPNKDFAKDYDAAMAAFKDGKVAMILNGPWSTADVLSGTAFKDPANLEVVPVPPGPDGKQGSPVGGHNWVISQTAADNGKLDAAYDLISWINSPENQALFAKNNNLVPTHKAAYDLPGVADNPLLQAFKTVMEKATNRPVIPEGSQIYTDFTPNFQKALSGDASPADALKAVAEAWNTKLFAGQGYTIAS